MAPRTQKPASEAALLFCARSFGRFAVLSEPDESDTERSASNAAHKRSASERSWSSRVSGAFVGAAGSQVSSLAPGVRPKPPQPIGLSSQPRNASPERRPLLKRLLRPGEVAAPKRAKVETSKKEQSSRSAKDAPAPTKSPSGKTLDRDLKESAWGVDTMASASCTGNKDLLTNLRRCAPLPIKVADGAVVTAMYKGTAQLRLRVPGAERALGVKIDDVYFHERFDANLLSWGVMKSIGWSMQSDADATVLTTPGGRRVPASTRGRVTILDCAQLPERAYAARGIGRVTCCSSGDLVRLHERLGHVGFDRLVSMCKQSQTDGVGELKLSSEQLSKAKQAIQECDACTRGKLNRPALGKRGLDRGTRPGEVLHMDTAIVVLRDDKTNRKYHEYWVCIIDAFSEARMTVITTSKTDIPDGVIRTLRGVEAVTGRKVRRLHCDQGSEFDNSKLSRFCADNGTQFDLSPARQKEMNGIAERNVGSFKNGARTMMHHSACRDALWQYAARHQAYVWNRSRIAKRTGQTPFQAMYGRTPSLLHVGVFGCDVWVHQDRTQRDLTFDAKAEPGIYLGHDDSQSCAIVHMLRSGKVVRTRDVEFREGSFRNMRALRDGRVAKVLGTLRHEPETGDIESDDDTDVLQLVPNEASADVRDSSRAQGGSLESDADDEASVSDDDVVDDARNDQRAPQADPQQDWEVEKVVSHRGVGSKLEYQVQWKGDWPLTWEPARNLAGAKGAVGRYLQKRQMTVLTRGSQRARSNSGAPMMSAREVDEDSDDDVLAIPAVRMAIGAIAGCTRL